MSAPRQILPAEVRKVEAMVLAGKGVAQIAAATGRSISAIQNLTRDIGLTRHGEARPHRATIHLWGRMPTSEIAVSIGCGRDVCTRLAGLLGLGPNLADPITPAAARFPTGTRRYTKAELAWARENIGDPQAKLIAAAVGGIRVHVFEDMRLRGGARP